MKKYQIKYTSEKKSKSKMIKAEKISEALKQLKEKESVDEVIEVICKGNV